MTRVSLLRRAVAAMLVVFLHYVPEINLYMDDGERYTGRWGLGNLGRIAVGMLVLTALAMALDALLRRWAPAWATRLFNHVFLVALLSGALAALTDATQHPQVIAAVWCAGLTVIVGSLFWRKSRLVHFAAVACLIFSPLVPILFLQMLLWPRWDESLDPLPAAAEDDAPGPSTFIFVFDEWSWPRSSRDGRFNDEFPHLQALCKQATVYRNALSPYRETSQSLPRLIFQTDRELAIHDGRTWFEDNDKEMRTQDCRSLFQAAHDAHYRSYLLGFLHAYRRLLGGQVDVCRSYFAGDEAGPAEKLADELLENGRSWTDPLSRRYANQLCDRLDVKNWRAMAHRYRDDMFRLLAECPRRSFVLCHVPVPHAPFIFNSDGSDHESDGATGDVDGYRRQLGYVDTLVGQIVDALRRAGKYDDSMIVITSDHSWREEYDPAFKQGPNWVRRVPLVIKRPGQKSPRAVDERICTNQLMPLLKSVWAADSNNPAAPTEEISP